MSRVLHFTLGPVQGFISDAKRTRDLWAGSFLLSLLSGHAMAEVVKHGGTIVFPEVSTDPFFAAIRSQQADTDAHVGTLPNRFKANVDPCPDDIGELCRRRIQETWGLICERVWTQFVDEHAHLGNQAPGNKPRVIWDRQTKGFWDIAWVSGDAGADSVWLDLRKNWRNHYSGFLGAEDGDHCRLMGEFQEISGFHRTNARDRQAAFWKAMARGQGLDISENEPLSAVALVKRLFPRVVPIDGAIAWTPGGRNLSIRHWPSVSYIAAVPWLRAVGRADSSEAAADYFEATQAVLGSDIRSETETRLFDLDGERRFLGMDGHLLHRDGIAGTVSERIPADRKDDRVGAAASISASLVRLIDTVADTTGGQPASEFFAILKMDGDGIGALLSEDPEFVKKGLANFAASVIDTFKPGKSNRFDGVLIYAGGDDVLALMPVDTAIDAALELRKRYTEAFKNVPPRKGDQALLSRCTLSAAVVFSHFKVPIRAALELAGHYLDEVAKTENGRDSLAVAVLKSGGVSANWVSAFGEDSESSKAAKLVEVAGARMRGDKDEGFSGAFFHTLKQRYLPLFPEDETKISRGEIIDGERPIVDATLMRALLAAEYRKQFGARDREAAVEDVMAAIAPIMDAATPQRNTPNGPEPTKRGFDFDAGLVIRFLANEFRDRPSKWSST